MRQNPPTSDSELFLRSDTSRTESFSDGVLAIAVTILVLDLTDPPHPPGQLGSALLERWPAYLGYLASFSYVSVIWLNHHRAFARIRSMDRPLHVANFGLLLTTAMLAFPTGVLSQALQEDAWGADARVSVLLYAAVAALMCLSWLLLYTRLRCSPVLLHQEVPRRYVYDGQVRSGLGLVGYLLAGLTGWLVTPLIALVVYLLLPVFYFFSSERLPRLRERSRS